MILSISALSPPLAIKSELATVYIAAASSGFPPTITFTAFFSFICILMPATGQAPFAATKSSNCCSTSPFNFCSINKLSNGISSNIFPVVTLPAGNSFNRMPPKFTRAISTLVLYFSAAIARNASTIKFPRVHSGCFLSRLLSAIPITSFIVLFTLLL